MMLTHAQLEAYEYITGFIRRNGWSPTYAEIAGHLGVVRSVAYTRVKQIVSRGYLRQNRHGVGLSRPRAYFILDCQRPLANGWPSLAEVRHG